MAVSLLRKRDLASEPRSQLAAEPFDVGEEHRLEPDRLGRLDVVRVVVDEQGLMRSQAEAVETVAVDRRVRLGQLQFVRERHNLAEFEPTEAVYQSRPQLAWHVRKQCKPQARCLQRLQPAYDRL